MKRLNLFLLFSFFFISYLSPESFILRDKIYTDKTEITLDDLIENNDKEINFKNILIKTIDNFPQIITSEEIIHSLFNYNIYNVSLIGKKCTVYDSIISHIETTSQNETGYTPVKSLENYLYSFINNEYIDLKIKIIKTEPNVDLENITKDYEWNYNKSNYNIKEIQNLKMMKLKINKNIFKISFEIQLLCDVWISKQSFSKNDFFKKSAFTHKKINLSNERNIGSVVFNINDAFDTRFSDNINIGDILSWDNLKKNPILQKGELTKIILKRNNFEILLPCIASNDGYENEKIKIKLVNGKELFGTLKKYPDGVKYVEM